ncbi:hypothetical protein TcasGA2_TC002819 [Tribolium castaneum]|uniref:Uncharacterized protein n=1 Tax=Tribolium castaneum TaxID=7070 RepID=D6WIA1_TRICA|nr:hypothetical protein TcasGA2_TC002819 [Tribolium castaneum]
MSENFFRRFQNSTRDKLEQMMNNEAGIKTQSANFHTQWVIQMEFLQDIALAKQRCLVRSNSFREMIFSPVRAVNPKGVTGRLRKWENRVGLSNIQDKRGKKLHRLDKALFSDRF